MAYTTIKKSSDYFNTKLYSGSNGTQSVSGVGFQPDWSWLKCRSSAYNHRLFDAVRGVTKNLQSNATNAEQTIDEGITAFNSDGFSVKQGANLEYNASGQTYASWNWKANGAGSANTDGSINSTVSANTTNGFSIVSYTGTGSNATVGHGLGSLCKWIIIKRLNGTNNWEIGNTAMGWDKHIYFTTTAQMTNSNRFQNTAPTNSLFYIGNGDGVNASGGNYIAYCFADVQGFSKFGSYTGNANADGTFVYTGFKPAFVMVKNTVASGQSWGMYDNKRAGYNPDTWRLYANTTASETQASASVDFLSNGFKVKSTSDFINGSGNKIIYMAFAEEPLVGDNPATAR